MANYYDCSGCGLCALVCPIWTQNLDISLTPWGRAKALQAGATALDIQESIESCLSCGACETTCPEKIRVSVEEKSLRETLGIMPSSTTAPFSSFASYSELWSKLQSLLKKHSNPSESVTDNPEGYLELLNSKKQAYGLGEWLFKKKLLQNKIQKNDFYWMDAKLFHTNYEELVPFYSQISQQSECLLNWNLHRTAMPLGEDNASYKKELQYEWVLFNKDVKRILVEKIEDWKWLKEKSALPVFHILELVEDSHV